MAAGEGTQPSSRTCVRCATERPLSEFPLRRRGSATRQPYCRACKATYQSDWYRRNRRRHIRKVGEHNRRRRRRNKAIVEQAKSVACADCKMRYPPCVMDFDHVRGSKVGNVSEMLGSATVAALMTEIAKCDVVCANCHRLRTYAPDRRPATTMGGTRDASGPEQLRLAFERGMTYTVRNPERAPGRIRTCALSVKSRLLCQTELPRR